MGGGAAEQLVADLLIAHRVQVLEGQVLQLPLDLLHAQPVGDGRVDLHGLQGLFPLLAGGLVVHGAHIVEPVTDLDEDHPDVLGHGHEHFPEVLHLLLFLGGILHPGQLGDPLHQVGHRRTKELGDLLVGGAGVLNAVVQKGGDDGVGIQLQLGHDLRHRQRVGDEGGPILPKLPGVGVVRILEGGKKPLGVQIRIVLFYFFLQSIIALQDRVHKITFFRSGGAPTRPPGRRRAFRPPPGAAGASSGRRTPGPPCPPPGTGRCADGRWSAPPG